MFLNFLITGKSLPVHCVVEAIHSVVETRPSRENWRRPHVEMDTYVFIPANMPFQVNFSILMILSL